MEAENKITAIKAAVQPADGSLHHRTSTNMTGGIPSIKTASSISSFQAEVNNYMVTETMEEYLIASIEAAHENTGEQAQM